MVRYIKKSIILALISVTAALVFACGQLCYDRLFNTNPFVQLRCIELEPAPLSWACEYGLKNYTLTPGIVKEMNANGGVQFGLMLESKNITKSEKILTFLISNGVDINAKTSYAHFTSLHMTVLDGDIPHVKLLLKYGARIDVFDEKGRTPLDLARMVKKNNPKSPNHDEVIRILEEKYNENEARKPLRELPSKTSRTYAKRVQLGVSATRVQAYG